MHPTVEHAYHRATTGIRQAVVGAEPSLADSRVLGSFTRVDPDGAAPALHP